jgi:hypothetical protein
MAGRAVLLVKCRAIGGVGGGEGLQGHREQQGQEFFHAIDPGGGRTAGRGSTPQLSHC